MLKTDFKIAALIAKYIAGDIEPQEQAELDEWINTSEHNKSLFVQLVHPSGLQELRQMAERHSTENGWDRYLQKQHLQRRTLFLRCTPYAAIFLILLSVGYFYFYQKDSPESLVSQPTVSELIVPGGTKATLTLADGSAVDLDEYSNYRLEEKKAVNQTIDATTSKQPVTSSVYHKIETPRGGEYVFNLSDGTLARLNAMSAIHFPVDFGNQPRVVELEGEAFFEVTNTGQPFIIKTKDMKIEVMGTSFNITSYTNEACSSVTLVSGSIRVQANHSDDHFVLSPLQQALFDRYTGEMSVHNVGVSAYTGWYNGMFYFKDWTLESIMNYLSRWYDIDQVVYKDEHIKNELFGCKFSKYDSIDRFLAAFERTGKIRYNIQGKTILFNNNN